MEELPTLSRRFCLGQMRLIHGLGNKLQMMAITVAAFLVVVFMGKASHGARTNVCDTHPTFVRYVKCVDV